MAGKTKITKREIDLYQYTAKPLGFRRIDSELMNKIEEDFNTVAYTSEEAKKDEVLKSIDMTRKFLNGQSYPLFSKLPQIYQNFCITKMMDDIVQNIKGKNIEDEAFRAYLDSHLLQPGFQTALELVKSEIMHEKHPELDANVCDASLAYMNSKVLENTLAPIGRDQISTADGISGTDIERNTDKQGVLATNFMLAHLGGVTLNEDVSKDEQIKYTGTIGDIYAHGSRTMFVLPKGKDGDKFEDALYENVHTTDKVVHYRVVATHAVDIKKTEDGKQYLKEEKSKGSIIRNKYMNVPLGGLGQKFGDDWVIKDKGQDGHLYIKYSSPSEKSIGYAMFGMEGEASGKTGRNGNTHGPSAIKAPISPFGATKHVPGVAMGGRIVDLQAYDQEQLINFINEFKAKYVGLQEAALNPFDNENKEKVAKINKCLCGSMLSKEDLHTVLGVKGLGMSEDILEPVLGKAIDDPNATLDNVVKSQYTSIVKDASKDKIKVNPEFNFAMDNFEALKDAVKADKEAKKILGQLKVVISANEHQDDKKYAEDLRKLHFATHNYLNKASFSEYSNSSLMIMIEKLERVTERERILRNEFSKNGEEIEGANNKDNKKEVMKLKNISEMDFEDNQDAIDNDFDEEISNQDVIDTFNNLGNNEIVINVENEAKPVSQAKADYDRMKKENDFADTVKANGLFLDKMIDSLSAAADLTWKDSKAFKDMHNAVSEVLDVNYKMARALSKGDFAEAEELSAEIPGKIKSIGETAKKYIDSKYEEEIASLKNGKHKEFSTPTNIKLFYARALTQFANNQELAKDNKFVNYYESLEDQLDEDITDKADTNRFVNKLEYAKKSAFADLAGDKLKTSLQNLFSKEAIDIKDQLNTAGVKLPDIKEKVVLDLNKSEKLTKAVHGPAVSKTKELK